MSGVAVGKRVLDDEAFLVERTETTTVHSKYARRHEPAPEPAPAVRAPSKHMHSKEETACAVYAADALGLPSDPRSVLGYIQDGHKLGMVDIALRVSDECVVLIEWDGSIYHGADRLASDVKKTERMLKIKGGVPVRVRVGQAAEFPPMEGVVVVSVPGPHPARAVNQIASQLASRVPTSVASGLLSRATGQRSQELDFAADAAWALIDRDYADQLRRLDDFLGSPDLRSQLMAHDGVRTRIDEVLDKIRELVSSGMRMEDVVKFENSFWAAVGNHPDELKVAIDAITERGVPVERLASLGGSFWAASVHKPIELAAVIDSIVERGVPVERLASLCGSFWAASAKKPVQLAASIEAIIERGVAVERLASLGNSFWAASAKNPIQLAVSIDAIIERGVAVERLASLGDSFWSASTKKPVQLAASIEAIIERGVPVERLASLGDSFWSASAKKPVQLAASIEAIVERGIPLEQLSSFGDCYWSGSIKHPVELASVFQALVDRGMAIDKIASMNDGFWSGVSGPHVLKLLDTLIDDYGVPIDGMTSAQKIWVLAKRPGGFEEITSRLAECRTTGEVNKYIRTINYGRSIGKGATKCMHARPILSHEPVVQTKTKQTSLASFFGSK